MEKLTKRSEGVYCADMKPGTLVYDNAENGEVLKEAVFTAYGKEYETDSEGRLVDSSAKPETKTETEPDEFLSPLKEGVSYEDFLKSVPEGVTVEDHIGDRLDGDTEKWILSELEQYQSKK